MDTTSTEQSPLTPEGRLRALLPQKLELDATLRLLPLRELPHMTLLDIGMPNPAMSRALRDKGGAWATIARSPDHAREAAAYLGSEVQCLGADGSIPYEAHTFDAVVVALDMLGAMPDPTAFVRECNRVLKASGLFVLSVQARRRFSLVDWIRRRRWRNPGDPYAATFTAKSLYQFLKTGFDVLEVSAFSRFFVELARLRERRLVESGMPSDLVASKMRNRYCVAKLLDSLFFWNPGHVLILSARRRKWSERVTPALRDGRTICEAVLFNPPQ